MVEVPGKAQLAYSNGLGSATKAHIIWPMRVFQGAAVDSEPTKGSCTSVLIDA